MMTSQEIQVLYKACREAGIDASKITPSNPFSKSGGTAALLQAAVALIDPAQAARWRVDAGGGLSIATLAELESGEQLSQQAQKDLWDHDPKFVDQYNRERQQTEAAMLKALDDDAAAMRLRNKMREVGGNEIRAKQMLANEAAADDARMLQKQQAAEHSRQFEQRMAQKRQQAARMAGVINNG